MYGGLLGAESSGLGVYVEGSQWSSGPLVFIIGDRDQIYIKCLYVYVHYCEAGSQYGFWADWYISGRFPIWLGIGTNTHQVLYYIYVWDGPNWYLGFTWFPIWLGIGTNI